MLRRNAPAAVPVLFALLSGTFACNTALAQGSPEEITVTARKTEESLQDVPISITAFSAEQILEIGAQNNNDIARMTVNFNTVSQIGRRLDRPVVRGMAAPAIFGEPNASYFVDGVYVSGSIAAATLGPVERVEILRGPQSAQFGRATFSGAINYVTRQPTNEFSSEVLVRGGNNESRFVSGWVSGPLVRDKLLGFASVSWEKWGGQWNNNLQENAASNPTNFVDPPQQADFSDLGKTDTRQATGKIVWNITDDSDLTFKANYLKGEDSHYPQLLVETDELNCFVPGEDIEPWDPARPNENLNYLTSPGQYCGELFSEGRDTRLNIPDIEEGMVSNPNIPGLSATGEFAGLQREQYNFLLQYTQDIGEWSFTARGAYNSDELNTGYDLEATERRYLLGLFHFYEEVEKEDVAFELWARSPADRRLRGSVGLYYFDYEERARQKSFVGLRQGEISEARVGTTENKAVFGSLEYDLSDFWTVTAEARYAEDVKTMQSPNTCDYTDWDYPDLTPPAPPPYSRYDYAGIWKDPDNPVGHEESTTALTPRFTLRYQGWDNAMIYLQAAKGNKPGAFNNGVYQDGRNGCQTQLLYFGGLESRLIRDEGEVVDIVSREVEPIGFVEEETSWTWEIGTKTSWLDNRVTANLALFYISWDNLTAFETRGIEIQDFPGISQSLGLNAGKATVNGLELETTFAFTDKLFGTFAYGYNDATYSEYASKAYADTTGEGLYFDGFTNNGTPIVRWDSTVNNLKGAQVPNSSKHNVVTSLAYNDQFTADLGWFARTDFVWESSKYTSGTNFEEIPERKLWNARAGLEHINWRLALFVNNILDQQTPSAIVGFPRLGEAENEGGTVPNGYALTPTPGIQYGLEAVLRFGN